MSSRCAFVLPRAVGLLLLSGLCIRLAHVDPVAARSREAAGQKSPALAAVERKLAESGQLYLVLDLEHNLAILRMEGRTLWSQALEDVDSAQARSFAERFEQKGGGRPLGLTRRLLGERVQQLPDSLLSLLTEATGFGPAGIQRLIPRQFVLHWPGVSLRVEVSDQERGGSVWRRWFLGLRDLLHAPAAARRLAVRMESVSALTLYGASRPGLPTLVLPPRY